MAQAIDLSDVFELGEPLVDRAYRGCDDEHYASDERIAVSRGERAPSRTGTIRWAMGGAIPGDVIWLTSGWMHIVGPRFLAVLEEGNFTGWRTYPVHVFDKHGTEVSGYCWLAVDGRCDAENLASSEVVLIEHPGGNWYPELKGTFFAEDSWDGSDLFCRRRLNNRPNPPVEIWASS